jgi:hypothetical protein
METVKPKLSEEALAYFRSVGKQGGQKAAQNMPAEARIERAKKASAKAAEIRSTKAAAKRSSSGQRAKRRTEAA